MKMMKKGKTNLNIVLLKYTYTISKTNSFTQTVMSSMSAYEATTKLARKTPTLVQLQV